MIPFSPPHIDQKIIDEVIATLKSGWITTGARTKQFEKELAQYTGVSNVLCQNSATAGLELTLRWFGVGEGDEVIVPAYTYCATANVVLHCGAKPIMVDVEGDFNISVREIEKVISAKTKVIIPVDIGGWPCDYDKINSLAQSDSIQKKFSPKGEIQKLLGRILVLSDAAHSIGASYHGKRAGSLTDATVLSFHAVKNLTTAEGGAICLNLPDTFDNRELYQNLYIKSLHGQTKDAFSKAQKGAWEYDVVEAGYKSNMPDVLAAIGLAQLPQYDDEILKRRENIFQQYSKAFSVYKWAQLPSGNFIDRKQDVKGSFHLYMIRIKGINESQRNAIIQKVFEEDVAVNVHFKPLPLLTLYKMLGYKMRDYPIAYDNYSREISLPVYYDLTDEQIQTVIRATIKAVEQVI
ncbi:MAG: DegT/DnrJ/EryC1/StrS family aminotransferase [Bacteroidia bacterium]|nr:DegT/DnrJ/EryC1/StrS family aminotransferase [Bacteroidia bacterium]